MCKRIAVLLVLIMLLGCAASLAENSIAAGDKVTFGKYWQHMKSSDVPADPEPIVWRVLDTDGDRLLLLADQPLTGTPYNSKENYLYEVTWETCSLRAWLNGDFLNDAFSSEEQQAIVPTRVATPDYSRNGFVVSGGNDTTDKVFLLSVEEMEKYLKTESSRQCCPTDYAVHTGAGNSWGYFEDDSYKVAEYIPDVCQWWLRSPGQIGHYAAYCDFMGQTISVGKYAGATGNSVRPALWVRSGPLIRKQ